MTNKALRVGLAGCVAFAALAATGAQAATVDDSFTVKIEIEKVCTVDAATDGEIDLGAVDSNAEDTDGSGTITVKCSKTLAYDVGLTPSNSSTVGAGDMDSATTADDVPYELFSGSSSGSVWGDIVGTNTVGGVGNGAEQDISVFAMVPDANFAPGLYDDEVTVTVTY